MEAAFSKLGKISIIPNYTPNSTYSKGCVQGCDCFALP
ncbi:unnamed protein product, partial [marine sediment metagenome]